MEVESSSNQESTIFSSENNYMNKYARRHKRRRKICMFLLCIYMLLVITCAILLLTVFRPKKPVVTLDSLALQDLAVSVDAARLKVFLNVTMSGQLSIENPNSVSFQYEDTDPYFEYRGEEIGEVHIPGGNIGGRITTGMNFTLTIMADRLSSSPNLFSDVVEKGMLELVLYVKLKGKVKFPLFIKVGVTVSTKCDISLDIRTAAVANQSCHSKVKL